MAKKKTAKTVGKRIKTQPQNEMPSDSDSDVEQLVNVAFNSCLSSISHRNGQKYPNIAIPNIASEINTYQSATNEYSANASDTRKKRLSNNGSALSSALDSGMASSNLYVDLDANTEVSSRQPTDLLGSESTELKTILEKSVITSNYEQKHCIPSYQESLRQTKKQRRKEKDMTKGKNWFDMPAAEMTSEKKQNLEVLQMRRVLDPKRFYKGPDFKALPKYFQMATVVENKADFYSGRIPKKQRKGNLVDELLADAEFRKFNKRKYTEIQEATQKFRGVHKYGKKLKNRKR